MQPTNRRAPTSFGFRSGTRRTSAPPVIREPESPGRYNLRSVGCDVQVYPHRAGRHSTPKGPELWSNRLIAAITKKKGYNIHPRVAVSDLGM